MAALPGLAMIVSGGQTGVDRAALDAGLALGLTCGGWVPRGRRAEDGRIPARYRLRETASSAYVVRTRKNVEDSDATLILTRGAPSGGTALTVEAAAALGRPVLVVDLAAPIDPAAVRQWLEASGTRVLNVAGPRESGAPGIYADAFAYLTRVLTADGAGDDTACKGTV